MKLIRINANIEEDCRKILTNSYNSWYTHWHRFYTGFLRGTNSVAVIQKHIIHSLNRKDNET